MPQTGNKTKFIPDIWITARYDGLYVIGRTFELADKRYASVVSELSTIEEVPYEDLEDIKALKITHTQPSGKQSSVPTKKLGKMFMTQFLGMHLN
jgi:hypothetical protein